MISSYFSQKLGRETKPGLLQQMGEVYQHQRQKSILLYYIYFEGK